MWKSKPNPQPAPEPDGHESREGTEHPAGPDETAALIDELQKQVETLRTERDEARDHCTRVMADYANSQKRAVANEQQARDQGTRGLLYSIMPIVDHFDMALGQDPGKASARDVIQGVGMIKDELLRALSAHGVGLIRPAPNDDFDPTRHEAVTQQAADGVEPGRVVSTLRVGYTLADKVVRPAQVSVAPSAN